jgi:hypothetical protein
LRLCAFASKRKKETSREKQEPRAKKKEPRDEKQDVRLRLDFFASLRLCEQKKETRAENREPRNKSRETRAKRRETRCPGAVRFLCVSAPLRAIERLRHEVRFLPQAGTSYQSLQLILKKKKKKSA